MAPRPQGSQGQQRVKVSGWPCLLLLLMAPFLLCLLRPRPLLLVPAAILYVTVVLPQALRPQMPQASPLWFPRVLIALLSRSVEWSGRAVQGAALLAIQLLRGSLKVVILVVTLPFVMAYRVLPRLHTAFLSLHGLRTITNQAVFFLLMEALVTPGAPLTALHTLLLYTLLLYTYHALYVRRWGHGVGRGGRGMAGLAAWWTVGRLGKGVATSCVVVMFTTLRAAHLHPHPHPTFLISTLIYFLLTLHSDSEPVWALSVARLMIKLGVNPVEDYWVWMGVRAAPVVASVVVAAGVLTCRPWLVVAAAYTNVVVPGTVMVREVRGRRSPRAALTFVCRTPTTQELCEGVTCPVCLERVQLEARVTPCHHLFHYSCLAACLVRSPLCPICRQPVLQS